MRPPHGDIVVENEATDTRDCWPAVGPIGDTRPSPGAGPDERPECRIDLRQSRGLVHHGRERVILMPSYAWFVWVGVFIFGAGMITLASWVVDRKRRYPFR